MASPARRIRSPTLPSYSSAIRQKSHRQQSGTWTTLYIPIPGVQRRQLRIPMPIPPRLYHEVIARYGRKRGCLMIVLSAIALLWIIFALLMRFGTKEKQWPTPFQSDTTLVFQRDDLRRIWEWEIESGHYPSSRKSKLDFLNNTAYFLNRQ